MLRELCQYLRPTVLVLRRRRAQFSVNRVIEAQFSSETYSILFEDSEKQTAGKAVLIRRSNDSATLYPSKD